MDNTDFISELSKLHGASTFLTLKGYRSSSGEIADHQIVFNMSYENALKRSINTLKAMSLSNDLERNARAELITSYTSSLAKINDGSSIEERDDTYIHFENVKGCKVHKETNTLHLYGRLVNKKVILPVEYKKVNSKPLTIAKAKLSSLCSVGKFRQYKITAEQVDSIQIQNISLLPPEQE